MLIRRRWGTAAAVLLVMLGVLGCSSRQMLRPQADPIEVKFQRVLSQGTLDEALNLLHQQPALANQANPGGWMPFETVIESSRPDRIEFEKALISAGANVNLRSRFGGKPLIAELACRGDVAAASLLVVHGADVNAMDSFGHTALDDAASCQRNEFARLMITSGAREILWDTGFLGDSKVADELLLQNPALLDQRWQKMPPITPFEAALLHKAKTHDDAVVRVMLKYKSQFTVMEAAALGRTDLLRSLLSSSSLLANLGDSTGRTALDWALLEHERQTALFLFDHGAIPTTAELVRAIKNSDVDTVKLLLEHNVDKDQFIPG